MKEILLILAIMCVWYGGYLCGAKNTFNKLLEKEQQIVQMLGKTYRINVTEIKQ